MAKVKSTFNPDTSGLTGDEWDKIVVKQIEELSSRYTKDDSVKKILDKWHANVTIGYKHDKNFTPHINGFYMIFMVHGTWRNDFTSAGTTRIYDQNDSENYEGTAEGAPGISSPQNGAGNITLENPNSYLNMLATDIDIPDITEEYVSVSSRIRNSFVPSRDYFVSDFSISYIENINLDIIRYHESWHKYLNLMKRGEVTGTYSCDKKDESYFIDMPYTNAVWVVIFKPFTTEIQGLIKLMGVLPVTLPLKQIVGNRSASKLTVLNMSYKSADIFYKFYGGTDDMLADDGILVKSFKSEILKI